MTKIGKRFPIKHGKTGTKEHRAWLNMQTRCFWPSSPTYKWYGALGVTICERWKGDNGFINFFDDLGLAPPNTSLDRINPRGNYEPGNCRWADIQQQQNNRRNNKLLTYQGRTQTMALWAEEIGIHKATLASRLTTGGWTVEKALSTPPFRRVRPRYNYKKSGL